jgi:hypothetical protein
VENSRRVPLSVRSAGRISYKLLHMHGMSPSDISHRAFSHTRQDCGDVVASKFFPIEGTDGTKKPLCERDYFRRLNLVCEKCGMALRGSYVTACSQSHYRSVCFILFLNFSSFFFSAPQTKNTTLNILLAPSALPYSAHRTLTMNTTAMYIAISTTQVRFSTKCAGCSCAILKQFVEINRNNRDECWHPECYMINKVRSCFPALIVYPTNMRLFSFGMSKYRFEDRARELHPTRRMRSNSCRFSNNPPCLYTLKRKRERHQ